ncbi:TetR family transcriptional regulator [Rhodococcus opacus]|uniref:TetR family transcriptional regulator n=2 Tax=Rhodococcus opacus TaxID=37919 RepID=A0A2S8IZ31_RHOOP|nr:TetR family transcriptional regulator [Rhodococcus opacus]
MFEALRSVVVSDKPQHVIVGTPADAAKSSTAASSAGVERRAPGPARAELITAAERLFAERGIEAVSLREITREAGQRNTTSLQYHFGNREGLLRAIVDKHVAATSLRRNALLDHLLSRGNVTLREASALLVQPLVAKLSDDDGGPQFLQIAAELVNRSEQLIDPDEPLGALIYDEGGSIDRWSTIVEGLMPPHTAGPPLHRRFAAVRFTHLELGRRARVAPSASLPLFTSQLVDLVAALLGSPLSEETERLLMEREREVNR